MRCTGYHSAISYHYYYCVILGYAIKSSVPSCLSSFGPLFLDSGCVLGERCVNNICTAECSPSRPCSLGFSCVGGFCYKTCTARIGNAKVACKKEYVCSAGRYKALSTDKPGVCTMETETAVVKLFTPKHLSNSVQRRFLNGLSNVIVVHEYFCLLKSQTVEVRNSDIIE